MLIDPRKSPTGNPTDVHGVTADVDGLRIVNVPNASQLLPEYGVDVHGAPARGLAMHTNGHLGADLLHIKAGDQFPVHTHPGDHLLFCVAGEGTMSVNGRTYKIIPGDLYMVDGMVPHAVGAITDHVILAIGAPHKPVDSPERMTFVDWTGRLVDKPLTVDQANAERVQPGEIETIRCAWQGGCASTVTIDHRAHSQTTSTVMLYQGWAHGEAGWVCPSPHGSFVDLATPA